MFFSPQAFLPSDFNTLHLFLTFITLIAVLLMLTVNVKQTLTVKYLVGLFIKAYFQKWN